jgi:D-alanine-D-alanine ligase
MNINLQSKTIGVLMGGLSPEREVSLVTGKSVLESVRRQGLTAKAIDIGENAATQIREAKVDLAFIGLHGTFGEDGTIQGILEYLKIPYTGAGVLGSAIAYNKVVSKELFKYHGIPTADHQVFYRSNRGTEKRSIDLPLVVKPSDQGSSIGVSIVREESQWRPALDLAFKYSAEVLVEQFIEGRLLAIGMRGEEPLPIIHIRPKSGFYDYEAKYTAGKTEYICPALEISPAETARCREVSVQTVRALKARGFPRVDAILDAQGTPYILELNTIPGMTPTSLLPKAARQAGLEFDQLVAEILQSARLDLEEN